MSVSPKVFRRNYEFSCSKRRVVPSSQILRWIDNQKFPLQTLSFCHYEGLDEREVFAFLETLRSTSSLSKVHSVCWNFNKMNDHVCDELINIIRHSPCLTNLELFGNLISNRSCVTLGSILVKGKLKRLKLGDNLITDPGAMCIGKGLLKNSQLIQLHLGKNLIGNQGVISIVDALHGNTTLTSLGLRDNKFGSPAFEALAYLLKMNTSIVDLQMKGNNVDADSTYVLSRALLMNQTLRVLELPNTNLGPLETYYLANGLQYNTAVHAINLNNNHIGDEGVKYLTEVLRTMSSVSTIGVRANNVTKLGGELLADLVLSSTCLTGLDLGFNHLGDEGVMAISNALKSSSTIRSLDLRDNNIYVQGISALSDAMDVNKSLTHLDLASNYTRDNGAQVLAKILGHSCSLTRLSLTDNEITDVGGKAIEASLRTNTSLRFFGIGGQSQEPPKGNTISLNIQREIKKILMTNNSKDGKTNDGSGSKLKKNFNMFDAFDMEEQDMSYQQEVVETPSVSYHIAPPAPIATYPLCKPPPPLPDNVHPNQLENNCYIPPPVHGMWAPPAPIATISCEQPTVLETDDVMLLPTIADLRKLLEGTNGSNSFALCAPLKPDEDLWSEQESSSRGISVQNSLQSEGDYSTDSSIGPISWDRSYTPIDIESAKNMYLNWISGQNNPFNNPY
eukprot:NODE_868_length_2289_cov_40.035549_g742_i0.p1 GENE.NODE_868_length_2289_cov_40.035549_g742_i0~~NODE_868_length_2289_cov_40.035549_g742_i0.p1  ORF type:complete len:677 (-),score=116.02 NODE_868_length_2289_cov_40.035549_g742_i0:189-2219(-)